MATYPLTWDAAADRVYETGVKRGVLYPTADSTHVGGFKDGVAWNGLTAVTESPSGAEETALYADDIKYLSLRSAEEFGATVEAYTYPDAWMACDGTIEAETGVTIGQQKRNTFGLCYRTVVGDAEGNEHYKLHLIYGGTASPSERAYQTVNDSPEAITFSWEIKTTPTAFTTEKYKNYKPTACITIDSEKAGEENMTALEEILYGKTSTPARLPSPDEVLAMFATA